MKEKSSCLWKDSRTQQGGLQWSHIKEDSANCLSVPQLGTDYKQLDKSNCTPGRPEPGPTTEPPLQAGSSSEDCPQQALSRPSTSAPQLVPITVVCESPGCRAVSHLA